MKRTFWNLVTALLGFVTPVTADEGMWVYNNLPKKYLKSKFGFEPTQAWAEHVMRSSVRFNSGGSGSFVSSNGLVITNHHVGADTLHKLSTPENNVYEKGFLARTPAEEVPSPDLELNQLVSIEDVTERVNAAVKPEATMAEKFKARQAVMANIEKESLDKTGLRSDVVTLYQGGQYHLYRYKKYTDVRLVFAPEASIAFFGGDPDNFEFPRYDLDICIFRVYENGKPAKINHFFAWSPAGAKEELIFVSGHPGRTNRLYTVAALKHLRDELLPFRLQALRRSEILLQQFGNEGEEPSRRARDELFGVQNSRKALTGMLQGLQDPRLMERKEQAEKDLLERLQRDPQLAKNLGAWERIAAAQAFSAQSLPARAVLEGGLGFHSQLFSIARNLVRMAEEDKKPNAERLREFRESNRASLEQQLFSTAPIYPDLEEAQLAEALGFLVETLGADEPMVKEVLAGKSPVQRAADLVNGTKLADVAERKRLAQGGAAALAESKDPLILLAKLVDGPARKLRLEFEEKVQEAEQQAYAQIAEALFKLNGTNNYPDATFTLRLAFGIVKGYIENGKPVPPFTTLGGAFQHEAAHGGKEPWKLPVRWHQAKDKLDLSTPFNFVSTADIIGGNSGSPVFNREAQFVGIIFDGNIQSLSANYMYSEEQARAVSVDSRAIRETLRVIYDASFLADQLGK